MNTKNLVLLVVVALLLLASWYLWGPTGSPLTSLNGSNFPQFVTRFNADAGQERLLVLVSPT